MPANILTLPPEILCRIFLHLSLEYPCDFGLDSMPLRFSAPDYHGTSVYTSLETQKQFGWILPVMQTCRTWRRAALADPELWATNLCSFRSKKATECFLQRCKGFDKLVFASKTRGVASRITKHQVRLAEENIARVKIFEQSYGVFMSASFAKALSTAPLPNLCILRMCRWRSAENVFVLDDISLHAPALQELYLDSVFFKIDAPNLRTLEVGKEQSWIQGIVSPSLLLSTLRGTPLLKNLALTHQVFAHDQIPDYSDEHLSPINDTDVQLPHLRSLFLHTSNNVPQFYQRVNAAPSADVQIVDDYVHDKLATMFAMMECHTRSPRYDMLIVNERHPPQRHPSQRHLSQRHPSHMHVCMRSSAAGQAHFTESGETVTRHSTHLPDPSFRYDARGASTLDTLVILQGLLPYIDLSRITFLDLGQVGGARYSSIGADDLRDIFARFTSVTTVQLNGEAWRGHIGAICGSEGQAATANPPLPALQHLVVQGIVFSGMESFNDSKRAWSGILRALLQRKRDGRPIRFLTLCDELVLEDAVDVEEFWSEKHGTPEEVVANIKNHEEKCMSYAADLVEKVFDLRGRGRSKTHDVKWMKGRLTEFVQDL